MSIQLKTLKSKPTDKSPSPPKKSLDVYDIDISGFKNIDEGLELARQSI